MPYNPTQIETFDLEEQEKVLRAKLVKSNLDLIAKETKKLEDLIRRNKQEDLKLKSRFDQDEVSFRHNFLAQW